MTMDELQARAEINDVILRYFRAMDRVDDELGFSIFHDDGTGDYGQDIFAGTGRDLIRWLNEYNRTLLASHHQMSNSTMQINGETAGAETYVTATLILPGSDGSDGKIVRRVYGRYLDRLSRRDGRWAIDHRHYRRDFFWQEQVSGLTLGETAERTPTDRSYAVLAG